MVVAADQMADALDDELQARPACAGSRAADAARRPRRPRTGDAGWRGSSTRSSAAAPGRSITSSPRCVVSMSASSV